MAYDWLISEGNQVPFVASADIEAGEWVIGTGDGTDTIKPATSATAALGIAATSAYETATPCDYPAGAIPTNYKQVTVYMEGIVKASVTAASGVEVGTKLEVSNSTTLTETTSTHPTVAIALDCVTNGSTETIRVKIVQAQVA